MKKIIYIIIALASLIIIYLIFYIFKKKENFSSSNIKFKVPPSFTKLKSNNVKLGNIKKSNNKIDFFSVYLKILGESNKSNDINQKSMPSFFNCNEKWEGCLPRPLYQGNCGSCWGFATVTCLSSRFFIESCGTGGCNDYPQINTGSLEDVYSNINSTYGFKKIFLESINKSIDSDSDGNITLDEWLKSAEKTYNIMKNDEKKSHEDMIGKYLATQTLIYMLDFQSLGSVNLSSLSNIRERAIKSFNTWANAHGSEFENEFTESEFENEFENKKSKYNLININKLKKLWRNQPLNLSAEKLITCCIECMKIYEKDNNPVCSGGSMTDAWILLRDTGTVSTLCIGYNLDSWKEGNKTLTCSDVQGPFYSFCSGYVNPLDSNNLSQSEISEKLEKIEKSGIYPAAIQKDKNVPWKDPQLFRFRAKNAYTIKNDVGAIQREIIERGPVNSGIIIYKSFYAFGEGLGGQNFDKFIKLNPEASPLGDANNSLIYMKNPEEDEGDNMGGHAITIVGWGTYIHKFKKDSKENQISIPYWTCLNSWGVEWGHSGFPNYKNRNGLPNNMKNGGYFWIIRGINNCGIEENVVCGQPNLENISYPGTIDKYGWGLPPPNENDAEYLPNLEINKYSVRNDGGLEIEKPISGGGTYNDYELIKKDGKEIEKWAIKSMTPPSPYVMFWPGERPIYKLGKLGENIDKEKNVIKVDFNMIKKLEEIIKIYRNPLMLINDEQVQLDKILDKEIVIYRGVNYGKTSEHKNGSIIKIFPYERLSADKILNILKK